MIEDIFFLVGLTLPGILVMVLIIWEYGVIPLFRRKK